MKTAQVKERTSYIVKIEVGDVLLFSQTFEYKKKIYKKIRGRIVLVLSTQTAEIDRTRSSQPHSENKLH